MGVSLWDMWWGGCQLKTKQCAWSINDTKWMFLCSWKIGLCCLPWWVIGRHCSFLCQGTKKTQWLIAALVEETKELFACTAFLYHSWCISTHALMLLRWADTAWMEPILGQQLQVYRKMGIHDLMLVLRMAFFSVGEQGTNYTSRQSSSQGAQGMVKDDTWS